VIILAAFLNFSYKETEKCLKQFLVALTRQEVSCYAKCKRPSYETVSGIDISKPSHTHLVERNGHVVYL
jgi:IS1 family transposase